MKKSTKEIDLLKNFNPSKFSGEGFLGNDTRSPEEIILSDMNKLAELGIDKEVLIKRLKEIYNSAVRELGAQVNLGNGLTAVYHESMGKIPSPFKGEGTFEKGEVLVTDRNNDSLIITRLSIHLIEKHGFFQGLGSRYRIDPKKAAGMIGLIS